MSITCTESASLLDLFGQVQRCKPLRIASCSHRRSRFRWHAALSHPGHDVTRSSPLTKKLIFDIAQTVAVGQLSESHSQELIRTGEGPESSIPVVSFDTAPELLRVNLLHHLRKGGLDRGHAARYHPGFELPTCFAEKSNQSHHLRVSTG